MLSTINLQLIYKLTLGQLLRFTLRQPRRDRGNLARRFCFGCFDLDPIPPYSGGTIVVCVLYTWSEKIIPRFFRSRYK